MSSSRLIYIWELNSLSSIYFIFYLFKSPLSTSNDAVMHDGEVKETAIDTACRRK
jgi:hypothetical protein